MSEGEKMERVIALVVTYNRKKLLAQCLESLFAQTYNLDRILVINNCSTDGTELLFEEKGKFYNKQIEFITMKKNLGGAGGFEKGFKIAAQYDYDWLWIMDDDTIPEEDALENLLKSKEKINNSNISFLASTVYGPNKEPMNVPKLLDKPTENGYSDWYFNLEDGIVPISEATFVSLLINKKAINKLGFPIGEYFIWGDDTEYTRRIVNGFGKAYFCGKSKVLHKRFNAKKISIFNEDNINRIKIYSYYYRNSLINSRKFDGRLKTFIRLIYYVAISFSCFFRRNNFKFKKFYAIQKGIYEYLFKSRYIQ